MLLLLPLKIFYNLENVKKYCSPTNANKKLMKDYESMVSLHVQFERKDNSIISCGVRLQVLAGVVDCQSHLM